MVFNFFIVISLSNYIFINILIIIKMTGGAAASFFILYFSFLQIYDLFWNRKIADENCWLKV